MSDPDFEAHYERLLKVLDGAVQLLWSHGEDHWGAWLERQRGEIADGNRCALDHLLSGFGGMGNLNDLVIHPINGHAIAEGDVDAVNKLLQAYLSEIWGKARAMKRDLNR